MTVLYDIGIARYGSRIISGSLDHTIGNGQVADFASFSGIAEHSHILGSGHIQPGNGMSLSVKTAGISCSCRSTCSHGCPRVEAGRIPFYILIDNNICRQHRRVIQICIFIKPHQLVR